MKLIGFLLLLSLQVFAADIIANNTLFKKIGEKDSFAWAPTRYQNDFRYDIFYYIPKSLENSKNAKVLIFKHGGGGSTMDRAGSVRTVNMYFPDLMRLADELGIIVVAPSANGLNWGGHTRGLLRELATLLRTHLNVDANKIGVSGHSMGGMGITRNYLWGADEFAFYLPQAAGMDEKQQTEEHLNKAFNIPYVHLQGLMDHFDVFITRSREQEKRIKALEAQYGQASKFRMTFYNGSHNYDYNLFKSNLANLFNSPRDLYQKELYGSIHTVKRTLTENNINFDYDSEARYFWVELADSDLSEAERVDFRAKVEGQKIFVDFATRPLRSKKLKIYISKKMLSLNLPIKVYVDGQKILTRFKPLAKSNKISDDNDPGFKFDDVIDIDL